VYPRGASSLQRLDAYVARFATVEVNNTFYRWPKEEVFATWRQRTPAGFVFSIKASRGLTQFRKLNDPIPWLERMDAGLRWLGDKAGVLLFQLPPHFPYTPDRLARFLDVAPSWPRLAIEFRHPTWHREETFSITTTATPTPSTTPRLSGRCSRRWPGRPSRSSGKGGPPHAGSGSHPSGGRGPSAETRDRRAMPTRPDDIPPGRTRAGPTRSASPGFSGRPISSRRDGTAGVRLGSRRERLPGGGRLLVSGTVRHSARAGPFDHDAANVTAWYLRVQLHIKL
jgi:hypothetical protein